MDVGGSTRNIVFIAMGSTVLVIAVLVMAPCLCKRSNKTDRSRQREHQVKDDRSDDGSYTEDWSDAGSYNEYLH